MLCKEFKVPYKNRLNKIEQKYVNEDILAQEKIRKGKTTFIRNGLQICFWASSQSANQENVINCRIYKEKDSCLRKKIIPRIEAGKKFLWWVFIKSMLCNMNNWKTFLPQNSSGVWLVPPDVARWRSAAWPHSIVCGNHATRGAEPRGPLLWWWGLVQGTFRAELLRQSSRNSFCEWIFWKCGAAVCTRVCFLTDKRRLWTRK